MKQSIGNAFILYMVVFIVGIIMLFFIGILSYSKAYRVKNRIIDLIEKNNSYAAAQTEINQDLQNYGYLNTTKDYCTGTNIINHVKNEVGSSSAVKNLNESKYSYCIFEINDKTGSINEGNYYIIVTFVHFDIPIIGNFLTIPVYGETRVLNKKYNY